MRSLTNKPLSESYKSILIRDKGTGGVYSGDGESMKLSFNTTSQVTNGQDTLVWHDTDIPAHNDPSRAGSLAFGRGISTLSENYATTGTVTTSFVPDRTVARNVFGLLGVQSKRESSPSSYGNLRTYTVTEMSLGNNGVNVSLKCQDNADGLNGFNILNNFTANASADSANYTDIGNAAGGILRIEGKGHIYAPIADGTVNLGLVSYRWKDIYSVNGTIQTSDGRLKSDPVEISDELLDAWADVSYVCYRWLDSVRQKGDDARWHFGVIAQQVRDAFLEKGIDGTKYGLLCYDSWSESTNDDGEVIPSGDRWGIRADQCAYIEAAYQRRELSRIKDKLSALELALTKVDKK